MSDKLFHEESTFEYYRYTCKVLFMKNGYRCGYVEVPKDHPLYGKSYDEYNEFIDCYGGLTYSEYSLEGKRSEDGQWIGFDCNHCDDDIDIEAFNKYFPNEKLSIPSYGGTMKTLDFCEAECRKIVDQLVDYKDAILFPDTKEYKTIFGGTKVYRSKIDNLKMPVVVIKIIVKDLFPVMLSYDCKEPIVVNGAPNFKEFTKMTAFIHDNMINLVELGIEAQDFGFDHIIMPQDQYDAL